MAFLVHGILIFWLAAVPWAASSRVSIHLVVAAALVLGLLFLPMVSEGTSAAENGAFAPLAIPGLSFLCLTKYKVISLSLLLAVLLNRAGPVQGVRLSWVDLPMVV